MAVSWVKLVDELWGQAIATLPSNGLTIRRVLLLRGFFSVLLKMGPVEIVFIVSVHEDHQMAADQIGSRESTVCHLPRRF